MTPQAASAKITDFETTFDVAPVPTDAGDVIWADIRIDYILSGLAPPGDNSRPGSVASSGNH